MYYIDIMTIFMLLR